MRVELTRIEEPFHFVAYNESGQEVHMDASPEMGGRNRGMRPMEMILAALAGCSSVDVVHILQKQRQRIESYRVIVDAERETGKEANLFRNIHIHFELKGDIEEEKLMRAISLSIEKYCSVAKILEKTSKISYSYKVAKK
ncbi:MAG: OsmC family protein [Leptospiraceae bacterium]|nr:OsmC family protein [Leptospiraceae bacterium]MDW8307207.1 OsmC family protein [Leptospiraceae bacterium]